MDGHRGGGGATGRALGLWGWGFYGRARPWSPAFGGWRLRGIRGMHPIRRPCVVAWARCKGGQGHAPGVTPWPALPLLSGSYWRGELAWAWRRSTIGLGSGCKRRQGDARAWASCGCHAGSSGSGSERRRGARERCWAASWAAHALGLAGPSCQGFRGLLLFSFLFYFSFHLHCLNLNLVLVFEFKNWCTKFIRVLDM